MFHESHHLRRKAPSLFLAAAYASSVVAGETALPPAPATASAVVGIAQEDHLRRGLAYYRAGDYVSAIYQFEKVLRLRDLPQTPYQQADLYAEEAEATLAGQRLRLSGYGLLGGGYYSENDTEAGTIDLDTPFFSARVGGRANYQLSPSNRLNLTLDYRYRHYDEASRRDFHDLRWNGNIAHNAGDANVTFGVRGRESYRGNSQWRTDYGVFTRILWSVGENDQLNFGAEARRRAYPEGRERPRSRNIVEFSGGWSHAMFGGKANISLDAAGGLENATDKRPDGDTLFVSLSSTLEYSITDRFGGNVMVWWQNEAFNLERFDYAPGGDRVPIGPIRNDDLIEVGGGLTYELGDRWSVNADALWARDFSNVISVNYSSIEVRMTLRRDF